MDVGQHTMRAYEMKMVHKKALSQFYRRSPLAGASSFARAQDTIKISALQAR